jgi:hypothetical protein
VKTIEKGRKERRNIGRKGGRKEGRKLSKEKEFFFFKFL